MYTINIIDIILVIFIIIIFYYLFFKQTVVDNYDNDAIPIEKKKAGKCKQYSQSNMDPSIDPIADILQEDNIIFVEAQFHNDYRDTITAFNDLVPCQKIVFNPYNLPANFTIVTEDQVYNIVSDFINELNNIIVKDIPEYRNANTGWEEPIVDKKIKSGWDKQMEALGLPSSLYPDPAINAKILLVSIDRVERYETDTEIKYSVFMFIKKENVSDQLIIKVSFVMEISDVNENRNFFDSDNGEREITIEEIFMLGYLTKGERSKKGGNIQDFYNFENMEHQNIIDDKTVLKQLMGKYKERAKEMKKFNGELINDNIYSGLPPTILGYNSKKINNEVERNLMDIKKYN